MKYLTPESCEKIKTLVMNHIPTAIYNPQSAKGAVVMTLPFNSRDKFVELFRVIESDFPDV